jgi:5-(carboxyamino)imidazole ribonucleotide synthase
VLAPGATIGILGGGQLARMLALAGARLGLKSHIYSPYIDDPAFDVCAQRTLAEFSDEMALARFADSVDVITYEFENVPAVTAAFLSARKPVRPNPSVLGLTQDRLTEKQFLQGLSIETAAFVDVGDAGAARARFRCEMARILPSPFVRSAGLPASWKASCLSRRKCRLSQRVRRTGRSGPMTFAKTSTSITF